MISEDASAPSDFITMTVDYYPNERRTLVLREDKHARASSDPSKNKGRLSYEVRRRATSPPLQRLILDLLQRACHLAELAFPEIIGCRYYFLVKDEHGEQIRICSEAWEVYMSQVEVTELRVHALFPPLPPPPSPPAAVQENSRVIEKLLMVMAGYIAFNMMQDLYVLAVHLLF